MAFARLVLRLVVGGLFAGHGLQKLAGWFGGPGLEKTGGYFESELHLRPGKAHAAAAGATEAGCGALIALGLATPAAASGLIAVMLTAIRKVHFEKGVWVTNGGFEYNAVLIAALAVIVESGPGQLSLDAAFGIEKKGLRWAVLALAAGVIGSVGAVALGEAGAEDEEPPAESTQVAAAAAAAA
ncbi:MAG TPA: DoxX family protein [Gaiellaceae bacterium]|nr:DoxX family protein [Gaiellaceae bacterium]